MLGWLRALLRGRKTARPPVRKRVKPAPPPAPPPPPERDLATALAEAEKRMAVLPPEKAQLVRCALLVHRVRQSALAELSDDERKRLRGLATKAFLGGGK